MYLDIEGLPDQKFHYLIGVLVYQAGKLVYRFFWANEINTEWEIWREFLNLIAQYPDAPIYHYGSYEPRAIGMLSRKYGNNEEPFTARLVNVNKQVYGKVYFPVYSNQLKEIASFVGATWTSPNASGLQSLVWRKYWDETSDNHYKSMLLNYNEEDCHALKLLVDKLTIIRDFADDLSEVDFANRRKQQLTETEQEIHSQFEQLLKFAHFNYDKNKINFRKEENENSKNKLKNSKSRIRNNRILP